jgi:3-polyprenyl-4-hydroxybenzoate decarboxylase
MASLYTYGRIAIAASNFEEMQQFYTSILQQEPASYHRPTSLAEIIDQTVNRVLDLVGIEVEHELFQRWERERGEKMSQSVLVPRAGNLF